VVFRLIEQVAEGEPDDFDQMGREEIETLFGGKA
jgi:hypothetical protein